jgi:hypothetical protein
MNAASRQFIGPQLIRSTMLFFGTFLFTFSLNSYIIHKAGHAFGGGAVRIILMDLLFPLAGIGITTPFWKVLIVSISTWPLFLAIRVIYQSLYGINIVGLISFLIFGVTVATLTALAFKPVVKLTDSITHTEPVLPSSGAVWHAIGLGAGLAVLPVLLNPF